MSRDLALRMPAEGWRRNLHALTVASFMTSLGFVFVMPLLPLLMAELVGDQTAAATWSGLAFAVSPLLAAVFAPLWGWLGDRHGHRMMLLRALLAIGVLMSVMSIAGSALHIVLLRAGIGALGAFSVAAMAAVAATVPREETSRALGNLQAAQVTGSVVGPFTGGLLADRLGLRAPFVVVGVLFALTFLLVYWLYRDGAAPRREPVAAPLEGQPATSFLWVLAVCLFAVQFADSTFGPLLPLYLRSLGVPSSATASITGFTISVGALGAALSAYAAPRLGKRRLVGIVQIGLIGIAVLNLPVALASGWWQIPPLRALIGLLIGGVLTSSYALAAERSSPGRAGAIIGTLASAGMMGWASGAMLAGASAALGPRLMFGLNVALFASCSVWWWMSRSRIKAAEGARAGDLSTGDRAVGPSHPAKRPVA